MEPDTVQGVSARAILDAEPPVEDEIDPFEPEAEVDDSVLEPEFVEAVMDWIDRKDVLKGFRKHLEGVHRRIRFHEWSPEFHDAFIKNFDRFIEDEKFVKRVATVIRQFPDGKVIDPGSVGTFCSVLAGFLSMYCAFTEVGKTYGVE